MAEKQAVPYVMQCIELLFVSYFANQNDTACAESAYKIFEFIAVNRNRILSIVK